MNYASLATLFLLAGCAGHKTQPPRTTFVVSVRLLDAAGRPMAALPVSAIGPSKDVAAHGITDDQGRFRFEQSERGCPTLHLARQDGQPLGGHGAQVTPTSSATTALDPSRQDLEIRFQEDVLIDVRGEVDPPLRSGHGQEVDALEVRQRIPWPGPLRAMAVATAVPVVADGRESFHLTLAQGTYEILLTRTSGTGTSARAIAHCRRFVDVVHGSGVSVTLRPD